MLEVKQLSYARGLANITNATFTLPANSKIGIIGPNGVGKSTFFGLLQHRIDILTGEVNLPKAWRWNEVEQSLPSSQMSILEYVQQGHVQIRALKEAMARAEAAEDHEQLAELHLQMSLINGYAIEGEAASLLHGLGFHGHAQFQPVNDFSGGWRMRLNLARALINPAEGLLLDEPTNHLDLEALIWLEKWLKKYPGLVLIVAHDSAFLDNVVDTILNFEEGSIRMYRGNYSSFVRQRAERIMHVQKSHEKQMQKRAHLQKFVDRFKAKASKAKQAQSRMKQLSKLQDIVLIKDPAGAEFEFFSLDQTPTPLIRVKGGQIGYGEKTIIKNISFYLGLNERIGLLGRNGAGKSTFVKFLAGLLPIQSGDCFKHDALKIGYFSQDELEALTITETPAWHLEQIAPKTNLQQRRDYLAKFGLTSELALNPVQALSGGQRARLCLALLVWQRPNLLLLDEPTNHLDLDFREALTIALQNYEGTLVLVSHDRAFLDQTVDKLYLIHDSALQLFEGDLNDYVNWLQTQDSQGMGEKLQKQGSTVHADRKKLQNQVKALENKLNQLTQELSKIEHQLADENLYLSENSKKLADLMQLKKSTQTNLSKIEQEWLEAIEMLD